MVSETAQPQIRTRIVWKMRIAPTLLASQLTHHLARHLTKFQNMARPLPLMIHIVVQGKYFWGSVFMGDKSFAFVIILLLSACTTVEEKSEYTKCMDDAYRAYPVGERISSGWMGGDTSSAARAHE